MSSELLADLKARGLINQATADEELTKHLESGSITLYCGFDPTADSLHIGSLVPLLVLRRFQEAGHRPIALVGGATGLIGDPSFKAAERQLNTPDVVAGWVEKIRDQVSQFIDFEGDDPALVVNNLDWTADINVLDFLRDIGKHFSVNNMIGKESVRQRLDREGAGISFTEFTYMILQSYDFSELYRLHGCGLQIGGSDQWGNIVNGVELGRRVDEKSLFGLTTPLMTTASGAKMGKTAAGAVWLNEERLSSYDYYQFWRNTEDADVIKFMRLFTDMSLEQIDAFAKLEGSQINEAKKVLAFEAVKLCRGEEAALAAAETARKTFEEGVLADDLPTVEVARAELDAGIPAFDLFRRAELANTGGEARRLIKGGGAKINDEKVSDENANITSDALNADGVIKVSAGKKRHVLIKPV